MAKIVLKFIKIYQYFLSPLLGNRCRFYPSCSHYAYDAYKNFSFLSATRYTLLRIIKCHPFHPGGIDELPQLAKKRNC